MLVVFFAWRVKTLKNELRQIEEENEKKAKEAKEAKESENPSKSVFDE